MENGQMDIKSLSLEEMEPLLMELGLKKFQVKEVFSWLHQKQVESFNEMTNISKAGREALDKKFYINFLKITKKLVSSLDGTIKYLYELRDGQMVESVLMSTATACAFLPRQAAGWDANSARLPWRDWPGI